MVPEFYQDKEKARGDENSAPNVSVDKAKKSLGTQLKKEKKIVAGLLQSQPICLRVVPVWQVSRDDDLHAAKCAEPSGER
jgi:hypothetical protein